MKTLQILYVLIFVLSSNCMLEESLKLEGEIKPSQNQGTFFDQLPRLWDDEPNLQALAEINRGKTLFLYGEKDEAIDTLNKGLNKIDIERISEERTEYMYNIVDEALKMLIQSCKESKLNHNKKCAPLYRNIFYNEPLKLNIKNGGVKKEKKCPKCPFKTKHQSHLNRHTSVHYPTNLECPTCGKIYQSDGGFRKHKPKCNGVPPTRGRASKALN